MNIEKQLKFKIEIGEMLYRTIDLASKGFVPKEQLFHLDFLQQILKEMLESEFLKKCTENNNEDIIDE